MRLYVTLMRSSILTRWIQPAGLGASRPLRFRDGFCLRLPGRRFLLIARDRRTV